MRKLRRLLVQRLSDLAPLVRPVFIIGCGRSGTTILGETLGRHPQLAYVHEPRDIWAYEPRTDIWSEQAEQRGGRLRLAADDVCPEAGAKIAKAFAAEVSLQGANFLVEKLPIESFRIDYIRALFPDARFIHLVRNGIEVARSIARQAEQGLWFGHQEYKWKLLAKLARETGNARLVEFCATNELRGLLEWRLSIEAASEALCRLPRERWTEIRYEDLAGDPLTVCQCIETFLEVPPGRAMRRFASVELERRSTARDTRAPSPEAAEIAGNLLGRLGYLAATGPAADA